MSILKLEPGDKVNLSIVQVSTVEGKFGPQYLFTGSTPDQPDVALYLNVKTADQQFSRLGLSALQAKGQTLEIERVEKNGTKYTNINRPHAYIDPKRAPASTAKAPHTSGPHIEGIDGPRPIVTPEYGDVEGQRNALAALQVGKLETLFVTYEKCFDRALAVATNHLPAALITHEGVAAQAATLFIQASEKGLAA